MARKEIERPPESKEITMFQETVEQLTNNTIVEDYFSVLKKILDEGYTLNFKGHFGDLRTIQDVQHLKNYFNNIIGIKYFN